MVNLLIINQPQMNLKVQSKFMAVQIFVSNPHKQSDNRKHHHRPFIGEKTTFLEGVSHENITRWW